MTNENIIKQLKRLIPSLQYADDVNAVKGAIQALSQEPKLTGICNECLKKNGCEMYSQLIKSSEKYTVESCEKYISKPCVLDRRVDENTVVFRTIDGEEVEYVRKEPCDDTVSIRKDVLKCRVGNIVAYNVEWLKKHWQMEMDIVCGVKPCDDAISRQAVFDAISRIGLCKCSTNEVQAVDECLKAVEAALPVTQKSGKWIPVSEGLPEDRRAVLVTAYWHETYQVMMASYYGDGLWWCVPFNNCGEHMQRLKPKAWMPLPKPYEPQESEE